MTAFTITTALDLPRTAGSTGVPSAWIDDTALTFEALGCLAEIASHTRPGVPCRSNQLRQHPSDPPLAVLVADLVDAGYLVPAGDDRYELVHPDRLPPLPA
jgi:hypothetical protein